MKINDIKAAIKAKASTLNVPPIVETPVSEKTAASTFAQVPKQETGGTISLFDNTEPAVQPNTDEKPAESTPPVKSARKSSTGRKIKETASNSPDSIENIVAKYLRPGTDYDLIPNCGRKPSLLKAGAEHLAAIFKFRTSSEVVNRVNIFEKNFVLYEVATTVYNADGEIVAVGLGSCNSLERKFIKQGFAMSLNTVLKMARKRSYVDAILSVTGSSRIFTQDIEELAANVIVTDADTDH